MLFTPFVSRVMLRFRFQTSSLSVLLLFSHMFPGFFVDVWSISKVAYDGYKAWIYVIDIE